MLLFQSGWLLQQNDASALVCVVKVIFAARRGRKKKLHLQKRKKAQYSKASGKTAVLWFPGVGLCVDFFFCLFLAVISTFSWVKDSAMLNKTKY